MATAAVLNGCQTNDVYIRAHTHTHRLNHFLILQFTYHEDDFFFVHTGTRIASVRETRQKCNYTHRRADPCVREFFLLFIFNYRFPCLLNSTATENTNSPSPSEYCMPSAHIHKYSLNEMTFAVVARSSTHLLPSTEF